MEAWKSCVFEVEELCLSKLKSCVFHRGRVVSFEEEELCFELRVLGSEEELRFWEEEELRVSKLMST